MHIRTLRTNALRAALLASLGSVAAASASAAPARGPRSNVTRRRAAISCTSLNRATRSLFAVADTPDKMLALYSTFKTAMLGMSRSFALEYGEFGIRVNTILPGLIDTKLAKAFEGEEMKKIVGGTPLRRIGQPEEIGYAVLYLSSAAGAFVTGASLVIDGGASIASH